MRERPVSTLVTEWVIVADDLTGAADAAAPFAASAGTSVVVDAATEWPDGHVVAVDTDSRYVTAPEAAAIVEAVLDRAIASGRHSVFKKIDSLTRGNVGVEVAAALRGLARHGRPGIAVVAPAFPSVGRTTVDGRVQVDGAPAQRAGAPVDIVAALAEGGLRARVVSLAGYADAAGLVDRLHEIQDAEFDAAVIDCATDGDLEVVVRAADEFGPALLVGSGGLAGVLATLERSVGSLRAIERPVVPGNLLVVMGSYSPAARAQLDDLVAAGVRHVGLDHSGLASDAVADAVRAALEAGDVVVTPDPAEPVVKARAAEVAGAMGRVVAAASSATRGIVICGGETARASLRELGVGSLRVLGELQPGTVMHAVPGSELLLVTKSGGFGGPHAVTRILEQLRSSESTNQGDN
jgi:uncharacterized protein YgbK (DUF1537 family)